MDLQDFLTRQFDFSRATLGPDERRARTCNDIRQVLDEICAPSHPAAAAEKWADAVLLALDGLMRALATCYRNHLVPYAALHLILEHQKQNEQRSWPDWRTAPADKAIEHVRGEA